MDNFNKIAMKAILLSGGPKIPWATKAPMIFNLDGNKHKFLQNVAKMNILLISFKFSTKQGQTGSCGV